MIFLKFDVLDECNQKKKGKSLYKDSMKRGFYHFEREAHWATYQEDVDNLLNPNELQLNSFLGDDKVGGGLMYDIGVINPSTGKYDKERVRTNMLKQFIPFNSEMPMLLQFIQKMPSKMKAMLSAGEASDKKVVVCIVKTGTGSKKTQGSPMNGVPGGTESDYGATRIGNDKTGFIDIIPVLKTYHDKAILGGRIIESKGGKRNPIEEINALRSLCDRTTSAMSDAQSKFKTKCERDFMQELCSETNFGQADKTCGEAEALKD